MTGKEKWRFKTDSNVESTPAVSADGHSLYVGSSDMFLYCLSTATGLQKWNYETGGPVSGGSPVLSPDNKMVYFASWDYNVYALNTLVGLPNNGKEAVLFKAGSYINAAPLLSPDGKTL